jgi:hypothetical protein
MDIDLEQDDMRRILTIAAAALLTIAACAWTTDVIAGHRTLKGFVSYRQAQTYPWHGDYYDVSYGMPVALVVPPTAEAQAHLGWGVGATRVTPIQHQFQRDYPGESTYNRKAFRGTPAWPSSTDQFGDYYIRGPW